MYKAAKGNIKGLVLKQRRFLKGQILKGVGIFQTMK